TEHDEVFAEVARAYVEHNERACRKILPSVPIGYRNNPVRLQGTGYRFQVDGRLPATAGLRQAIHGTPGPSAGDGGQITGHREEQTTANPQKTEILKITDETVEAMVNGIRYEFRIITAEGTSTPSRATAARAGDPGGCATRSPTAVEGGGATQATSGDT